MAYKAIVIVDTQGDGWSGEDVSNMIEWALSNVDRASVTVQEVTETTETARS